jgi:hypothetical protein
MEAENGDTRPGAVLERFKEDSSNMLKLVGLANSSDYNQELDILYDKRGEICKYPSYK